MRLAFSKYHALQNDFLACFHRGRSFSRETYAGIARQLCHRRIGIGADGLLVVRPASKRAGYDARVDVFNQDGSWAEKSGNGLRIAAAFLREHHGRRAAWNIAIGAAIENVSLGRSSSGQLEATASLGIPSFLAKSLPMRSTSAHVINQLLTCGKEKLLVTCLSVGNPHCVHFCHDFDFDWPTLGGMLEQHRAFPNRTNVEFVRIRNRKRLDVREWERGVGVTASSGTGAAAALAAAVVCGLSERSATVSFEAGEMRVFWSSDDQTISIHGPITYVCSGEALLP